MYLEPTTAKRLHQPIITLDESFQKHKKQSQTKILNQAQSTQTKSTYKLVMDTDTGFFPTQTQSTVKDQVSSPISSTNERQSNPKQNHSVDTSNTKALPQKTMTSKPKSETGTLNVVGTSSTAPSTFLLQFSQVVYLNRAERQNMSWVLTQA